MHAGRGAGGPSDGIAFGEKEMPEGGGYVAVYACYKDDFAIAGWDGVRVHLEGNELRFIWEEEGLARLQCNNDEAENRLWRPLEMKGLAQGTQLCVSLSLTM